MSQRTHRPKTLVDQQSEWEKKDMFGKVAHLMYQQRRVVVGAWLVILLLAAALASQVGSVLGSGEFVAADSDSAKAAALMDTSFHQNDQKVTLVVIHAAHGGIA